MTPLSWLTDDLGVSRWELFKAFVAAPFLLAGFVALLLLIWLMQP